MVKKKIVEVEVCTCDRCRKELEADHWKIKMTRTIMDRELDLCDECEMLFKAFMMNKPYEVPETDNVTEKVKGTEETIVESETDSYVGILSSDIDFKRGFPTRLRSFMDKNQFTQKDMAELIGVGTGTISNWLRGTFAGVNTRTQPKLDKAIRELGI